MKKLKLSVIVLLTLLFVAGPVHAGPLQKIWLKIIDSGKAYTTDELMPIFKRLKPIDTDFMLGTWKGGKFDGGLPDPINWYGKRFVSRDHVEPLLVTAEDGSIQVYEGLGQARMREIRFEGVTSASLIYDKYPIMDYFRKIDDNTVVGYGETKGKDDENFFFYLIREEE